MNQSERIIFISNVKCSYFSRPSFQAVLRVESALCIKQILGCSTACAIFCQIYREPRAFRAALRGLVGQNWVSCVFYAEFNFQLVRSNFRAHCGPWTEILAKNWCNLYKSFPGSSDWQALIKKREIWINIWQLKMSIKRIYFMFFNAFCIEYLNFGNPESGHLCFVLITTKAVFCSCLHRARLTVLGVSNFRPSSHQI